MTQPGHIPRHPERPFSRGSDSLVNLRKQVRKVQESPCNRPPAWPDDLVFSVQATEARTHLRFTGKVKWTEVTDDSSGFPIDTVDRYEVRVRACNSSGVPVETEDNFRFRLKSATNPSGSIFEFKTKTVHSLRNGDTVVITG